ncbi:MAG: hypothetical protein R2800_13225 [Flavipsychrobacter sp.]
MSKYLIIFFATLLVFSCSKQQSITPQKSTVDKLVGTHIFEGWHVRTWNILDQNGNIETNIDSTWSDSLQITIAKDTDTSMNVTTYPNTPYNLYNLGNRCLGNLHNTSDWTHYYFFTSKGGYMLHYHNTNETLVFSYTTIGGGSPNGDKGEGLYFKK